MLVLTRRVGEVIVVDGRIRIKVTSINRASVRIGIDAPPSLRIVRSEIQERPQEPSLAVSPAKVTQE
jgi:carbon storage regulator